MPLYINTLDGVTRELTHMAIFDNGIKRELEYMDAMVDGVSRNIFRRRYRWEKHSVRHYFNETGSEYTLVAISALTMYKYAADYKESEMTKCDGRNIAVGDYFYYDGTDRICTRANVLLTMRAKTFTSYRHAPDPAVIEIVESFNPTEYLDNGEMDDGFWYIKIPWEWY